MVYCKLRVGNRNKLSRSAPPELQQAKMEQRGFFFFVFCLWHVYGKLADTTRPNIVFMMADDLGYADLGYSGGVASTPNLDDMAAGQNTIRLSRYYSGGPVCSPTRGTILTGRNHNRFCVWSANTGGNSNDFEIAERMPLPHSEITIAEILQKAGYKTGMFGKWHLGDFIKLPKGNEKWPTSHPGQHGFEEWWATERSAPSANMNCACFNRSLCIRGHYNDDPPCTNYYTVKDTLVNYSMPENGDDAHFIVDRFSEFLESVPADQPFFAYLPFHNVHVRFLAYEGYIHEYFAKGFDQIHIDYYGAISAMDDAVGRVRKLLKSHNIAENTMLWFTSDNGPAGCFPGSAKPLHGCKGSTWEGGIRVPGLIEWPSMIQKNRNSSYAVVSTDLLPTACDILGVSCPSDRPIDGESILPLISGKKETRNSTIKWAYDIGDNFDSSYSAVVSGDRYKLRAQYDKGDIKVAQLYDLIQDVGESTDVSDKFPDVFNSMKTELEDWMKSVKHSATEVVKCMEQ